jgi:HEAT repeat protein
MSGDEAEWFLRARKDGDVETLIEALRHPELRSMAVRRLGELRADAAVPMIIPLLDAQSDPLRAAAARALGLLQGKEAFGKLIDVASNDSAPAARAWALYAVGCIGLTDLDPRVLPLASAPIDMVRHAAIAALAASSAAEVSATGAQLRASEPRSGRRAIDRVIKKISEAQETPV